MLNRFLLVAEDSCISLSGFKGIYFVSKSFIKIENKTEDSNIMEYNSKIDFNNNENKNKVLKARRDLYRPVLLFNINEDHVSKREETVAIVETTTPQNKSSIFGLYDFRNL